MVTPNDITQLSAAIRTITGETEAEDTIRLPVRPRATQGTQHQAPRAPAPPTPQTIRTSRPPGGPPVTYAAAAASKGKNIPKDSLPGIVQRVNKLRRDFPSISEEDAICYASTGPEKEILKQRRPGTAVVQGTKTNIVIIKLTDPEIITVSGVQLQE